MGFAGIGIFMLMIVFIFYLRMVDSRMRSRQSKSQIDSILDKVDVLESVGDDRSALALINKELEVHPNNTLLSRRRDHIIARLETSSAD